MACRKERAGMNKIRIPKSGRVTAVKVYYADGKYRNLSVREITRLFRSRKTRMH